MSQPAKYCIAVMLVMSVFGCSNNQSDKVRSSSLPGFKVSDKPAVLATIKDDEQPPVAATTVGTDLHSATSNFLALTFASQGGGVAYTVGKADKVYVVHNGKAGSLYNAIGSVVLSPDGSRIAYAALVDEKWRMIVDGQAGEPFSTAKDPKFSPDSRHVAYQGMKGDKWHLVVDTTVNSGTTKRYRPHEFSGDSAHIIYIDDFDDTMGKGRLVVSELNFKNERIIDPAVSDMIFNSDRTAVAAISKSMANRQSVIRFTIAKPEAVQRGAEFDKILDVAFDPADTVVAYIAERQKTKYGVFNSQEEILPKGLKPGTPVVNLANKSVGVLMSANNSFYLHQMFRNSERTGKVYDAAEGLVYSSDGAVSAFAARKGNSWFVVVNGTDGSAFDRVVSPKFSPDGKFLVYRARKDGKRFVVVADASGKILRQLPTYEQVFDVQFTSDGTSVAYGVKDGNKLAWQVEKL
jgi:WD40 repeat protein